MFKLFSTAVSDTNFAQSIGVRISKGFYVLALIWHFVFGTAVLVLGEYIGFMWTQESRSSSPLIAVHYQGYPIGYVIMAATLVVAPLVTIIGVLISRYSFEWSNAVIISAATSKK